MSKPVVLILGTNSDVAKQLIKLYVQKEYHVVAASRDLDSLKRFTLENNIPASDVEIKYFDATDFNSHNHFYNDLPVKPTIAIYAAGYLKNNEEALRDWEGSFQMMKVHYAGAVSILNIIAMDESNHSLKQI